MGTYGQFLTRKAQGSGDKRLKPGVKQNLPSLPTSPKKETSTEAVGASITNGAFANGHGQLTRVDAAGNKDVPVVNNGKTKDNIPVATSGEAVDTSDTPTEVPTVPSGTGDTKVPTGTWNDDGSQFTTGDGLIWTPDEYGILYADIDGQKVTWGSYYEGTAAPVYTSAETESGGYDGYLSSYPSYEEYLTGAGAEIQGAYSKAVQNAKQEYAMNRATYGARGEQLGRAGLTGSGYGDYLEGAAYSAMQGAISQAELGRAQSYAAYLTEQQQSAASYAAYLTQKEEQDAADRSSYINGTLYQYALSNSSLTAEDLMRWANGLDPSLGGKSHNLTYAEAEKLLTSAATQRKMNGTDAATVRAQSMKDVVADVFNSVGNGGTITEEQLKFLLGYTYNISDASDEELAQIKTDLGGLGVKVTTQAEVDAANDAATADTKTYNAMLTHLQNGGTERTEADLITKIREIDPSISDERAANIAKQLLPVVEEMDETQNAYNAEAIAIMTENYESFDDADALRLYLQGKNYNDAAINAAIDEYYKWNEYYISKSIDNMNVSDLMSQYSLEQLQSMKGKTITSEQADDLFAKTQQKAAELLKEAYNTYMSGADDEAVRAILGIDAETWGTMGDAERQTELFRTACDIYDAGSMSEADMTAFVDRLVNDRVNEDDFDVEDLGKLAIEFENNLQPKMWETYLDKLADLLMIEKDGTVNIRGTECEIKWLLVSDHPLGIKSDVTGKGEITCINGKLYQYTEEYYQGTRVVRQVEIKLKQASEDQERSIEKLIIRALSKKRRTFVLQ